MRVNDTSVEGNEPRYLEYADGMKTLNSKRLTLQQISDAIFQETGIRISPYIIRKCLISQGEYKVAEGGSKPRYLEYVDRIKELHK
ncbi:MAG: hypothetical protein FWC53_00205 [Firmicutes bacterium]|nr:hypothetical protein [Bacillota bacterium]